MQCPKGKLKNSLIVIFSLFALVAIVTLVPESHSGLAFYAKSFNRNPDDLGTSPATAWQKPFNDNPHSTDSVRNVQNDMGPPQTNLGSVQPVGSLLHADNFPKNVFYVWCGLHWFEFQNYVSMLGAIKVLQPNNIFVFYEQEPRVDQNYYTWFDEINEEYPFLYLRMIDRKDNPCDGSGNVREDFLFKIMEYEGGIYIHKNTVMLQSLNIWKNQSVIHSLDKTTGAGFLAAKPGVLNRFSNHTNMASGQLSNVRMLKCANRIAYEKYDYVTVCLNIDGTLYPNQIWEVDDKFGRTIREISYGNSNVAKPAKSYVDLVPNIAHFVWIGGGKMDFLFYLGVLSAIYAAEVDQVYIHGDIPPTGEYWDQLVNHVRVTFIRRDNSRTVYGQKVENLSHLSDVWRVDIMIKYGGIYMDTDSVLIRPLDSEHRAYGALASYDCIVHKPFPNIINFGVTVGKRNSRYWREFQKSMKLFKDGDWLFNGLCQPYKVKERYPALLQIDPRLQIICYKDRCHPTYWPNWEDQSVHHLNTKSIPNWRNDSFAFHWTYPLPKEFRSEKDLRAANTMFAEIGKYILEKAGKLK